MLSLDSILKLIAALIPLVIFLIQRSNKKHLKEDLKHDKDILASMQPSNPLYSTIKNRIEVNTERIYGTGNKKILIKRKTDFAAGMVGIAISLGFVFYEYKADNLSWLFFISLFICFASFSTVLKSFIPDSDNN